MKGYCVDVRGFSEQKKEMVVKAVGALIGYRGRLSLWDGQERLGNVSRNGVIFCGVAWGEGKASEYQVPHLISFDDLMLEAGFNYVEDGAEGFKAKSPNKTRPLITREQYDAVMAQSDKRTFTKALDDLLAIEKEQLLDESAIRISQLESAVEHLNKAIELKDEQLDCALDIVNQVNSKNARLVKCSESELANWVELDKLNSKHRQSLEKHKRISGVLSLLLISSVAAQLAVIFLGG